MDASNIINIECALTRRIDAILVEPGSDNDPTVCARLHRLIEYYDMVYNITLINKHKALLTSEL